MTEEEIKKIIKELMFGMRNSQTEGKIITNHALKVANFPSKYKLTWQDFPIFHYISKDFLLETLQNL